MSKEKEGYYIYHYCLNENLPVTDPNYCDRAWVDVAHGGDYASAPQNWKYCPDCVAKGFPEIKSYTKGRKIRQEMITKKTGYVFSKRELTDEQKEARRKSLEKARLSKTK